MRIDTYEAIFNFVDILAKYRIISLLVQCPKNPDFLLSLIIHEPGMDKTFLYTNDLCEV